MAEKVFQGRRHCSAVSLMVVRDHITTEWHIKQPCIHFVKFVYYIKKQQHIRNKWYEYAASGMEKQSS